MEQRLITGERNAADDFGLQQSGLHSRERSDASLRLSSIRGFDRPHSSSLDGGDNAADGL
jgi:hypothetical protein